MKRVVVQFSHRLCWVALMLVLTGCGSTRLSRAPVEDRPVHAPAPAPERVETPATPVAAASATVKLAPGFENVGRVGYYTVKPGDTLLKISLEHGQSFHDLANWNQLANPNVIEVGQVLRVIPPESGDVVIKPVPKPVVATAPVDQPAAAAPAVAAPAAPSGAVVEPVTNWIWPANGTILAGFDEVKNKGIDLAGRAGDPVLAVADGRVVYVGAGLRGYGNLIILKHDNVFLTAYAHNRTLLVKEDQSVIKGQKIAEMGDSDTDRVKLHFEVRRQGKPVDPLKHLPAR